MSSKNTGTQLNWEAGHTIWCAFILIAACMLTFLFLSQECKDTVQESSRQTSLSSQINTIPWSEHLLSKTFFSKTFKTTPFSSLSAYPMCTSEIFIKVYLTNMIPPLITKNNFNKKTPENHQDHVSFLKLNHQSNFPKDLVVQ